MDKEKVLDYVMNSPGNSNRAVLSGMLDGSNETSLPEVTNEDNGMVLTVVEGEWDKAAASSGAEVVYVDFTWDENGENLTTEADIYEIATTYNNGVTIFARILEENENHLLSLLRFDFYENEPSFTFEGLDINYDSESSSSSFYIEGPHIVWNTEGITLDYLEDYIGSLHVQLINDGNSNWIFDKTFSVVAGYYGAGSPVIVHSPEDVGTWTSSVVFVSEGGNPSYRININYGSSSFIEFTTDNRNGYPTHHWDD